MPTEQILRHRRSWRCQLFHVWARLIDLACWHLFDAIDVHKISIEQTEVNPTLCTSFRRRISSRHPYSSATAHSYIYFLRRHLTIKMTRIYAALLVLAIIVNESSAFTISMVPLLTRLGPFGNHYANQASQNAPSPSPIVVGPTAPQSLVVKPQKFKFEYSDAHMISDYKSEIMEYVYDKSLHRGFV